jgi:hypothetical protein
MHKIHFTCSMRSADDTVGVPLVAPFSWERTGFQVSVRMLLRPQLLLLPWKKLLLPPPLPAPVVKKLFLYQLRILQWRSCSCLSYGSCSEKAALVPATAPVVKKLLLSQLRLLQWRSCSGPCYGSCSEEAALVPAAAPAVKKLLWSQLRLL